MASLETRRFPHRTSYRLVFRLHGRKYGHTLDVTSEDDARAVLSSAERTLALIAEGRVAIPAGADVGLFVATDGRLSQQPSNGNALPLGELFDEYVQSNPEGHLEDSTLLTMRIHLNHAAKLLGKRKALGALTFDDLQGYVNRRAKEKNRRGNPISPVTIRKEIVTLSGMWNWAASLGKVEGSYPGRKLKFPATSEPPRFQTWQDIERQIKNGGSQDLWDSLFVNTDEIAALLKYAETHAYKPYVYPMLVAAAHTGARRSELIRCQAEDIDFKAKTITIRERKRERGHHGTRTVPMSPLLRQVLKKWLARRTSGATFTANGGAPLSRNDAHAHLQLTLAGSKWEKIKGWHTLRHSFASNLAAKGVDQRVIDEILGHMSERMARRYRHFAPNVKLSAVQTVFG